MMTLLLALENKDALSILQHKTVRTQLVNSKSILIQQEFTIENLPTSPRISFCFHIVLHFSTFQDVKILIQRSPFTQEGCQIDFFMQGMEYEIEFVPVDTEKSQVVYEDHSVTVETIPLQHRVPCCGYIFREKPTLPHIRRDMIDYYEIPVSQINNIKNGADWTTKEGDVIPNARLVMPATTPRSYAYCSDTRFVPGLAEKVKGVTVLYHESTYTSENEDRAKLYYHSTARQAATIARNAGVGKLLLGHYSARYNNEEVLLNEAKEVFAESYLTQEGKVFSIE